MLSQLRLKESAGVLPPLLPVEYLKKLATISSLCLIQRQESGTVYKKPQPYASLEGLGNIAPEVLTNLQLTDCCEREFRAACKARECSIIERPDLQFKGVNFHEYAVPIISLAANSQFNGHRILHLSDIHLQEHNDWMVKRLFSIAEAIPQLRIDTVAITGDLADSSPKDIDTAAIAALSAIVEQVPRIYFTPGNHDYDAGVDSVLACVRKAGIKILIDEHLILGSEQDALQIIGLDDVYHRLNQDPDFFNSPCLKTEGLNPDCPTIVLAHSIDSLCAADNPFADLVLSGHTHGLMFKGVPFASLFLEHHFGQKLLHHHNRQASGIKALSPRTISIVSNGLVDRYRYGFLKSHPFIQPPEALILELRSYET